jgi:nitrile hydratase subunit alpha
MTTPPLNYGSIGPHDASVEPHQEPELTGRLRAEDRDYTQWEKQIHAALVLLIKKGLFSADELRAGQEQLESRLYYQLSYYEKWTMSMVLGLVRRGVISRQELEQVFLEWKLDEPISRRPFKVGDKVTVKPEALWRRWRRPHLRIPGLIHGATGEVTEVVGKFWDPAYTAFCDHIVGNQAVPAEQKYRDELKQPLYRVRFRMGDVWHYAKDMEDQNTVNKNDFIFADIFHPWLVLAEDTEKLKTKPSSIGGAADPNKKFFSEPLKFVNKKDGGHYHGSRCMIEAKALKSDEKTFPLQPLAEAFLYIITHKKNLVSIDAIRKHVQAMEGGGLEGRIAKGQRLVARAWVDPEFKKLLLTDPTAAAKQLGIMTSNYTPLDVTTHPSQSRKLKSKTHHHHHDHDHKHDHNHNHDHDDEEDDDDMKQFGHGHTELRVVADTDYIKNLVTCTLCSCYPASLLGTSPAWYKTRNYRSRSVTDPRGLLRDEFGLDLSKMKNPEGGEIELHVHDSTAEVRYLVLPQRPKTGTEGWTEEQLQKIVSRDSMIGVALIEVPNNKVSKL